MVTSRGILMTVLVVGCLLNSGCFVSCVPSGHVGVVSSFGEVESKFLPEGMNVVAPWKGVTDMSIRTQELKEHSETPSSEGMVMAIEASLLYRILPEKATMIYQSVGPNYEEVLIVPNFRSAIRAATSSHKAEALYSSAREQVAIEMQNYLEKNIAERGIVIESVLLRDLSLPPTLKTAVEAKQKAEQEALQMEFVLQKEQQEAQRKRVEAGGIKDFQDIVTQGISDKLLKWKGIEATERLSASPNSKIVIIGSGSDGLPVILNP